MGRSRARTILPYAILGSILIIVSIIFWVRQHLPRAQRVREFGSGKVRSVTLPEQEHAAAKPAGPLPNDESSDREMPLVHTEGIGTHKLSLEILDRYTFDLDYQDERIVHFPGSTSEGSSGRSNHSRAPRALEDPEVQEEVDARELADGGASARFGAELPGESVGMEGLPTTAEEGERSSKGRAERDTGGQRRASVRRRAPERRGGRYHREVAGTPTKRVVHRSRNRVTSVPFMLKCRLEGMRWVLGLEPLEEGIEFWQGGNRLHPKSVVDTFYPIRTLDEVLVRLPSGQEQVYPLAPKPVILFQLHDLTEGTLITGSPVTGRHYLLVAPVHSLVEMHKELVSELLDLENWSAYVVLWEPERIPDDVANSLRVPHNSEHVSIMFNGKWIEGVDQQYRAFREPPRIRWRGQATVAKLVLRLEERRAGRVWTRSFSVEGNEVEIPPVIREEMMNLEAGRFTVRCYDTEDQLVGSDDFRLIVGLHEVRQERLEDNLVRVQFILADGYRVEPDRFEICPEGGSLGSSFVVDPTQRQRDPAQWDLLQWRVIAPSGATVPVGVNLERFFWVVEDDSHQVPPGEWWGCHPARLSRQDFQATSSETLWLWIPPSVRRERAAVLEIIEKQEKLQHYVFRVDKTHPMKIPLRDLGHLMPERIGEYTILLYTASAPLCIATIEIRATCRRCGYDGTDEKLLWRHIHIEHGKELFYEIDPEEYWSMQGKPLPERVYQCLYCGKGFAEGGYDNANTLIGLHQRNECHEARRRFPDGPVVESFRVLERDQPKEMILALTGRKWRCRLCDAVVSQEEQKEHLQRLHALELLQLR